MTCRACDHDFWSCRACGRLYHLDRTSCVNNYCPDKGRFWTTRFGADEFHQQELEFCRNVVSTDQIPRPGWTGGATAGSDIRWPHLHTLGLILSVQESGVVELWAERGAPQAGDAGDFGETSVCLTRLDLGEESPCAPFSWQKKFFIAGSTSISELDMTSSPSIGKRIPVNEVGRPRGFAPLRKCLFAWGDKGVVRVAEDGFVTTLNPDDPEDQPNPQVLKGDDTLLLSDGSNQALLASADAGEAYLMTIGNENEVRMMEDIGLKESLDYGLYADRFILISGNKFSYLEDNRFVVSELPATVIAPPLYSAQDQRIFLFLNDGSARSCSTTGDKFSFVCDLAGTPTTRPLKLGERLFYGTEGRYLCCDEEAIRPRLSSSPMGALSYANNRVFGTSRDGSMFCFEL